MRVLVTLSNIIEYGLDTITGNSREALLIRAAEMREHGYDMFVNLPDIMGGEKEAPTERNVFEHFSDELPEPDGATHSQEAVNLINPTWPVVPCSYAYRQLDTGEHKWICLIHDSPSKHHILESGSKEPCLIIDPYGHDWDI